MSSKTVPENLTLKQNESRMNTYTFESRINLNKIETNPKFLERMITCDALWIFTYDHEIKCGRVNRIALRNAIQHNNRKPKK